MRFEEVIDNLYSNDDKLICETLNSGLHVSGCMIADNVVSTGFCCRIHTDTVFEVLYLISQQTVCYMQGFLSYRFPMGLSFKYNPDLRLENNYSYYNSGFFRPEEDYEKWYNSYDIESGKFNIVITKDLLNNSRSFVLDNNMEVSSFSVFKGQIEVKSYPLILENVPKLFKSRIFRTLIK